MPAPQKAMSQAAKGRIAYIDWMRGLACLLMFQTHCYDSWLGGAARKSAFFGWSQLGGTLPAPLFLFLAGISFALVTDRMRRKGISANRIAATTIRRGAEIFALGLLFRLQEFAWRIDSQESSCIHNCNARAQKHGFTHIMGHKDYSFIQALLQRFEFALHVRAGERIERAKGFIHQQNRWIGRKSPSQADALALST